MSLPLPLLSSEPAANGWISLDLYWLGGGMGIKRFLAPHVNEKIQSLCHDIFESIFLTIWTETPLR